MTPAAMENGRRGRAPLALPFEQIPAADRPLVGGQGANPGEMARADFRVPPGFCVATAAFREQLHTQSIEAAS